MSFESSASPSIRPSVVAVPVRGLDLSGARLPAEHTRLVGREPELAGIVALLRRDEVRLLTITGPGGGGKTRVAIGAARRAASAFADGAAFVGLVSVGEPDLVAPAIFHALGGREAGLDYSEERLHQLVGNRSLLLVLDNFEHLAAAAPVVANLLAACPRINVLVTSRVALHLSGEHAFRIPPMSLPEMDQTPTPEQALQADAVRLFVQRARAARPDFQPASEGLQTVAKICQHLDGLPLAIELAAARVTHLSPAALLERLERPAATLLPLLTGGARDHPARFRTMRDTIAWSYDLLGTAERTLFEHLSVFPGRFSLGAAEYVGGGFLPSPPLPLSAASPPERGDTPSVLDRLGTLVANSLISYEGEEAGEPSYRMLETLREFGRERLAESGQEAVARQRHAAWALALAERAGPKAKGPEAAIWLEALERDHANLRSALGWFADQGDCLLLARMAGSLWPFWHEHAHYAEGRRWLEAALALSHDVPPKDRLRLLTGAGAMAWYQGDVARSRQMHEEALALAQHLGDRATEAFELGNLGVHAAELGDNALAISRFEASLEVASDIGDPDPIVLALFNLAYLDWERGDGAMALHRLEEALGLAREHGMGWILPNIMIGLGTTTLDLGDHERAIALLQESIALALARGNLSDVIDGIEALARVAAATGQPTSAARLFGAADALREAMATPHIGSELAQFQPIFDGLRDVLGKTAFSAAWDAGRTLSRQDAIDAALAIRVPAPAAAGPNLTEREVEVLRLLAAGLSNRELGDRLFISPATAARHVANIFTKLDVDSRAKAIAYAREHGLIHIDARPNT